MSGRFLGAGGVSPAIVKTKLTPDGSIMAFSEGKILSLLRGNAAYHEEQVNDLTLSTFHTRSQPQCAVSVSAVNAVTASTVTTTVTLANVNCSMATTCTNILFP